MRMRPLIATLTCLLGLGGCVESIDAPMSPTFGQALASMDAQIVRSPMSDLPPESSGAVGVAATMRYQKGEVKKPETQATSATSGQAGGSPPPR
ncbi:hypothetical protein [Phenylobacterium sp.]|jgi:hypothetical protein|uniref:hypothetical protein n=1 Tax=Phenylobacterium sp. TaxID=1871053 RepID=UPI0037849C1A